MADNKKVSFGVDPLTGVLLVGGLFFGYTAIKKIGETFGLVRTQEDEKADALRVADYMAPAYALNLQQQKRKFYGFPNQAQTATNIATRIYNSKSVFNDNEAMLFGALNQLQYKTQISIVSYYFLKKYNKDLAQYLSSFLSAKEMAGVYNRFDKLKTGIV